jgi:flagellar basal-body rod modification protein FlgD
MDIFDTQRVATQSTGATPAPATSTRGLDSDFDTFLTLLTAQIKNQDPLEPTDSTEFVAQLATFSNVEQGVKTNDLLEGLVQRMDREEVASAASWIGMEVRHAGAIAGDAGPRTLHVSLPAVADVAELVVTDARGAEVRRVPIDPKAETVSWPLPGTPLPAGNYDLTVQASAGDQSLSPVAVEHYATVEEVALAEGGGTRMRFHDGTWLESSEMLATRRP